MLIAKIQLPLLFNKLHPTPCKNLNTIQRQPRVGSWKSAVGQGGCTNRLSGTQTQHMVSVCSPVCCCANTEASRPYQLYHVVTTVQFRHSLSLVVPLFTWDRPEVQSDTKERVFVGQLHARFQANTVTIWNSGYFSNTRRVTEMVKGSRGGKEGGLNSIPCTIPWPSVYILSLHWRINDCRRSQENQGVKWSIRLIVFVEKENKYLTNWLLISCHLRESERWRKGRQKESTRDSNTFWDKCVKNSINL